MRRFLLKMLLKVGWSIGGASDDEDGLPRITGPDIEPVVPSLEPGDFLLLGNNGSLSHVSVYIGGGEIVHSMATEKTMRGLSGSLYDALKRPFRWLWGIRDQAGVLREKLVTFVDRFERDTYVVVRPPGLTAESQSKGVDHIVSLVGSRYDYTFTPGDDQYYCTEIVIEFLQQALPELPDLETKHVKVPVLLDTDVYEPIAVLTHPDLHAVFANEAAAQHHAEHLGEAQVLAHGASPGA